MLKMHTCESITTEEELGYHIGAFFKQFCYYNAVMKDPLEEVNLKRPYLFVLKSAPCLIKAKQVADKFTVNIGNKLYKFIISIHNEFIVHIKLEEVTDEREG